MIPPTPTWIPTPDPGTNPFTSTQLLDAWDLTNQALQSWHWIGNWGTVIQALILLWLVIFGTLMVVRQIRRLGNERVQEN